MTLTTTVVSTRLPATHPTQTSKMSIISGWTTTVPTTVTRIIPITREESRNSALDMTRAAGGLNPDERWKVFHPYDIPGIRRPTMTTPENIRRMAESEALTESVQTMEYLNEFPSMGERRDFRRFPPRYGDPHYHSNRLGRRSMESNQGRSDNQTDNTRSANRQDQRGSERRPVYGRGGIMSPMR